MSGLKGWTARDIPDQHGQVIIVTGANSGVGYESAVALAQKGAHVIMACRSIERGNQAREDILKRAPHASIEVRALDLGHLASVHAFAEAFNRDYDRLNVLMNNAGLMVPPYAKTPDGFELQFGTNHLGHFALTGLLLPALLNTPQSRIVTVTSSAAFSARINFDDLQSETHYDKRAAYGQSKLANLLFMTELQRKLSATRADLISVASQPGLVATPLLDKNPGDMMYEFINRVLKPLASQPADVGATYQLYAATAPHVKGGEFYGPKHTLRGEVVRVTLQKRATDPSVAARLWQISEQLTGVHYGLLSHTKASA